MENFLVMEAKYIWGNSNFAYLSSDSIGNFRGTWMPTKSKILIIAIYAPQSVIEKHTLWQYITHLIHHWNGECIVMGDFNEVRSKDERLGSTFNVSGANEFNVFIANSGLIDLPLEGYSFMWSRSSAQKMSKLDRHLSDHRPILLREIFMDFGATPFRLFHSWFSWDVFDKLVSDSCNGMQREDINDMVRFKKKLQDARDNLQKAKVKWALEGDENTKYFHGIMVDGEWIVEPMRVKEASRNHFASRFQHLSSGRSHINFTFPNRLSQ
ncbi:RNA-directed DNA polymerase, eukaryota [Tanacetum coccineum]